MKKIKFLLYISIILLSMNARAQIDQNVVYALMIHKFAQYTEWPANKKQGDFVIGVVGNTSVYEKLKDVAQKKKIGTRAIVVKKFPSVNEIADCHMIFVPESEKNHLPTVSSKVKPKNTVIVSEAANTTSPFIFNFIKQGSNVKFQLNNSNASAHGVKVSSKLVKLAIKVS